MRFSIGMKLLAGFISVSIFLAFAGVMGINFTKNVGNEGVFVGERLAPLADAAMEIRLSALEAHLIFEEILAGDTSEDIQSVWDLLNESLFYTDAILSGGTNKEGTFYASEDPKVLDKAKSLRKDLLDFIEIAQKRYTEQSGNKFSSGSKLDQSFDENYEKIQNNLSKIIVENDENLLIIKNFGKIQYLLSNSHLLLEELLAGDSEISFEEISKEIELANELFNESVMSNDIPDSDLILSSINTFSKLAKERHNLKSNRDKVHAVVRKLK